MSSAPQQVVARQVEWQAELAEAWSQAGLREGRAAGVLEVRSRGDLPEGWSREGAPAELPEARWREGAQAELPVV